MRPMEIEMSNVKNAPAGRYFREIGYSQSYPWLLVGISPSGKTATVARVRTASDPDWKPEIIPGGFVGHCVNQHDQTWLYAGVDAETVKIRLDKHGKWVRHGVRFVESDGPDYFYDYNF